MDQTFGVKQVKNSGKLGAAVQNSQGLDFQAMGWVGPAEGLCGWEGGIMKAGTWNDPLLQVAVGPFLPSVNLSNDFSSSS